MAPGRGAGKPQVFPESPKSQGDDAPASSSSAHIGHRCHEFLPVSPPTDTPGAAHVHPPTLQEFYVTYEQMEKWG